MGTELYPAFGDGDEMVNRDYEPNDTQEVILAKLKDGRERGEPWGRVNPLYLQRETAISKQKLNYHLQGLIGAGWVRKPVDGLYELVEDPREESRE